MAGRRRNFFLHGELPIVLLTLVGRSPVHGYELMQQLAALLGPAYVPSPGSIYPALAALVVEGLVDSDPGPSRRRRYRLTSRGRKLLLERRPSLRAFEVRTGVRLDGNDGRSAVERFVEQVAPIVNRLDSGLVDEVLQRAAAELETLADRGRGKRGRRI